MKGIRPNLIRAETVRLIDVVLESLADGRLDRGALRKLPPWRAVVLARIARRVGAMSQRDLDALTAEVVRVGVDGVLAPLPEPAVLPDPEYGPPRLRLAPAKPRPGPAPPDAPEWTQGGMVKQAVGRRHKGSRHPAVRDSTG